MSPRPAAALAGFPSPTRYPVRASEGPTPPAWGVARAGGFVRALGWAAVLLGSLGACTQGPALNAASVPAVATSGAPAPTRSFSVLTYNINRDPRDPAPAVRLLQEADADVVVLQESTPAWEQALGPALSDRYTFIRFRHYDRGGGLAVLSRMPLRELDYRPSPAGKYPGWALEVDAPMGRVRLLAVHLHAPVDDAGRFTFDAWLSRGRDRLAEVRDFVAAIAGPAPRLIVGDFNENEQGQATRWLESQGFIQPLKDHAPFAHTWSLLGPLPLITNRTDRVMHDPRLRCVEARVLGAGGSDHRAVLARFEAAAKADK